jgi:hypothetical protein
LLFFAAIVKCLSVMISNLSSLEKILLLQRLIASFDVGT